MSTSPLAAPLFARLVDDAAMFPPGNAAALHAIRTHLRYRSSGLDPYVGPLLVHRDRWDEMAAAHIELGSPQLHVVVVGGHRVPSAVPAGIRVLGFEEPVDRPPLPAAEDGLPIACEVTADEAGLEVLAEVASAAADGDAVVGKFRTGGTDVTAFPDEPTVAAVVAEAVRVRAPLKFTAGLHHAVRFTDPGTGFEHHGFLNLLVATELADAGALIADIVEVLGSRDGQVLADIVRGWTAAQVGTVRRTFTSFGCCGVEEPIRDLVELGLIEAPRSTYPTERVESLARRELR